MDDHYIYAWRCDGVVVYIGVGHGEKHERARERHVSLCGEFADEAQRAGKSLEYAIWVEGLSEGNAYEFERFAIGAWSPAWNTQGGRVKWLTLGDAWSRLKPTPSLTEEESDIIIHDRDTLAEYREARRDAAEAKSPEVFAKIMDILK